MWVFSPIVVYFWLCMTKGLYGECEMLNECICEEVYVVEILSGESGFWLKYCHGHLNKLRSVHFGKLTNHKILLCCVWYTSYHAKQSPKFGWVVARVTLALWINSWSIRVED